MSIFNEIFITIGLLIEFSVNLSTALQFQKVTAEIAMNVKRISEKIGNSETNADNLLNAMRTVQHSSQQIETLTNKVGVIERQIKDAGLGKRFSFCGYENINSF